MERIVSLKEAKKHIGYNQYIDYIEAYDEDGNAEIYTSDLLSPYDSRDCIGYENNDGTITLY